MQGEQLKVIVVDDDKLNLEILLKNLQNSGFATMGFEDGDVCWTYLEKNPKEVDILLLDKMMPRMNGMEVLARMKGHKILKEVPVIIQTGDVGIEETKKGLAAGAQYYLAKPFDPGVMISIVKAAAREYLKTSQWIKYIKQGTYFASLLKQGKFILRTPDEGKNLSFALSNHAKKHEEIGIALTEIIINAIEHGNLGLGYEKKSQLLIQGNLDGEIRRRLALPENKMKYIVVDFLREKDKAIVAIKDQGEGFKFEKYLAFDPLRLTDPNGRGIAASILMGLEVQYMGNGNEVICKFATK